MGIDDQVEIIQPLNIDHHDADMFIIRDSESQSPLLWCWIHHPDNSELHGKLLHYMLQLRHMYGKQQVYGIMTTLADWKICCLNDTLSFAESLDLAPSAETFPSVDGDELCVSRSIHLTDCNLGKWLILYLTKARNAYAKPVSLLSRKCMQVTRSRDTIVWASIDYDCVNIAMPSHTVSHLFNILRHLAGGSDGDVLLAITDSGNLCVLKLHHRDEDRDIELQHWVEIHKQPCFVAPFLRNRQALIMPLVFHVFSDGNGRRTIDFNLSTWCKEPSAVGVPCPALDYWSTQLQDKWDEMGLSIDKITIEAIDAFAQSGYAHVDLKWSHIGVLPIAENGIVTGLKPILIDLVRVKKCNSIEEAKANMDMFWVECKITIL